MYVYIVPCLNVHPSDNVLFCILVSIGHSNGQLSRGCGVSNSSQSVATRVYWPRLYACTVTCPHMCKPVGFPFEPQGAIRAPYMYIHVYHGLLHNPRAIFTIFSNASLIKAATHYYILASSVLFLKMFPWRYASGLHVVPGPVSYGWNWLGLHNMYVCCW